MIESPVGCAARVARRGVAAAR